MKGKSRVAIALVVLSVTLVTSPLFAQSIRVDGGAVSQDKFGFYWETRLEPSTPPLADGVSTVTVDEPGVIHRILLDRTRSVYVGYDVLVEPRTEPNTYRVTFKQLVMSPDLARRVLGQYISNWTAMPTPGWTKLPDVGLPAPKDIRGGDVIELRLLFNAATSQRVVDYVTVQEPAPRSRGFNAPVPERQFTFAPGPARDFRTDDVQLTVQSPRLSINGRLDESSARRDVEVSGAVVWLYTANRGRYLLSLVPHRGFRKAGEVRGSSLSFKVGNDTFSLSTAKRIAPGQDAFNLYVLYEPEWRPTYLHADLTAFTMGAADRPDSLIRR